MNNYVKDWKKVFMILACCLPVALLFTVYFANRSLFLDGINLARNISENSFAELSKPLKYQQSAPLLFLYLSKITTLAFGISEYTLRLIPFISGIAGLYFFGSIIHRITEVKYAWLGILWLGTHSMFVRYATEFKQYMTDAFVGMFLIWLTLRISHLNKRNVILLGIVGAMAIWLSMPSVFIIFGMVCYYFHLHYKSQQSILPIIGLAAWYTINFILEYFLVLQPAIDSSHMQNFHQNYFLQGRFWDVDSLRHDFGLVVGTVRIAVGKSGLAIAAAMLLIMVSIHDFLLKGNRLGLLLLLPLAAVFGASLLGKYSLIERLMLFALPILFLLIFYGLQSSIQFFNNKNRWVKHLALVLLSISFIVGYAQTNGLKYFISPLEIEDNRSALEYIDRHEMNNNSIVCTQLAYPAYAFYTRHDKNYNHLNIGHAIAAQYGESVVKLAIDQTEKDRNDVWVLMGHMLEKDISDLISELKKRGTIKNSYRTKRSAAILFSTQ